MAIGEAFHVVVNAGAQEQSVGWPTPELANAAVRQSRGRDPPDGGDEPRADPDGPRRVLPPPRVRVGKAKAITATARKLAILVYRTLKGDFVYCDAGADAYEAHQRTRVLRRLRQRAATLGFDLLNRETGEVLVAAVS